MTTRQPVQAVEEPLRRWRSHTRPGLRGRTVWCRTEDGSVAAEVTLVTPFLVLLLVFVGVVVQRGVEARIRIDDAAHQAARAASIERTPATAGAAARSTAAAALATAGTVCRSIDVNAVTGALRPGSAVTVTVSCDVDFGDAFPLGFLQNRPLSATAMEPIDTWRSARTRSGS